MITLKEAKTKALDSNVTMKVVQLELEKVTSEPRFKATFIVADEEDVARVTTFNQAHKALLENPLPQGLILINALHKGTHFILTSRSNLSMCSAFPIPDDVQALAGRRVMDINTALGSPVSTVVSVEGKVTKVIRNVYL